MRHVVLNSIKALKIYDEGMEATNWHTPETPGVLWSDDLMNNNILLCNQPAAAHFEERLSGSVKKT